MALGGLSLRESTPPGDAVGRVGTLVALLFLKTKPPPESSLSEVISSTLFPLSGGAGAHVDAAASGIASMGEGEVGVWYVWGEDGGDGREVTDDVGVVGGTSRAREPPLPLAGFICFKALASVRRLEESIIEPAPVRITKQRLIRVRKNENTCRQTTEVQAIQVSSHNLNVSNKPSIFKQDQVSASKFE